MYMLWIDGDGHAGTVDQTKQLGGKIMYHEVTKHTKGGRIHLKERNLRALRDSVVKHKCTTSAKDYLLIT